MPSPRNPNNSSRFNRRAAVDNTALPPPAEAASPVMASYYPYPASGCLTVAPAFSFTRVQRAAPGMPTERPNPPSQCAAEVSPNAPWTPGPSWGSAPRPVQPQLPQTGAEDDGDALQVNSSSLTTGIPVGCKLIVSDTSIAFPSSTSHNAHSSTGRASLAQQTQTVKASTAIVRDTAYNPGTHPAKELASTHDSGLDLENPPNVADALPAGHGKKPRWTREQETQLINL